MSSPSERKIVRRQAGKIPTPSAQELAEVRAIRECDIDLSDIPDTTDLPPLTRDCDGRLPKRQSWIREAVALTMADRRITVYALTKEAKVHSPTISETAVGSFLKGQRSLGIDYLEAVLSALGLRIVRTSEGSPSSSPKPGESVGAIGHRGA